MLRLGGHESDVVLLAGVPTIPSRGEGLRTLILRFLKF